MCSISKEMDALISYAECNGLWLTRQKNEISEIIRAWTPSELRQRACGFSTEKTTWYFDYSKWALIDPKAYRAVIEQRLNEVCDERARYETELREVDSRMPEAVSLPLIRHVRRG